MSKPVIQRMVDGSGEPVGYMFECPGCGLWHSFRTRYPVGSGPQWTFNGDLVRPTFKPSLRVRWTYGDNREPMVCHSFVTDGQIRFLGDCTHELAGKTVPLPEVSND